jgi:hypothetical protein
MPHRSALALGVLVFEYVGTADAARAERWLLSATAAPDVGNPRLAHATVARRCCVSAQERQHKTRFLKNGRQHAQIQFQAYF